MRRQRRRSIGIGIDPTEEELRCEIPDILCDAPIKPGDVVFRIQKIIVGEGPMEVTDDGDREILIHESCFKDFIGDPSDHFKFGIETVSFISGDVLNRCPECQCAVDECTHCGADLSFYYNNPDYE